jgi:hypothetical protein
VGAGTLAAALVACGAFNSSTGREGDLGNGVFAYNCQDDSDPTCPSGKTSIPGCDSYQGYKAAGTGTNCFPSSIAVGGKFRVQYYANPDLVQSTGNPTIRAVSSDYLESAGDGIFLAKKAGWDGVVATSTVNSQVVDYTILRITPIATLKLRDDAGQPATTSITLRVGVSTAYHVIAEGNLTEPLAGAINFTWASTDQTIVKLMKGNPTAAMTLQGLAAGKATISVKTDSNISVSIDVTVGT